MENNSSLSFLSQQLLDQIKKTPLLLGYFSFPECQVCKVLKPRVQDLVRQFPPAEYLYIDINLYPVLKGQFLVFTVPTLILFREGKELKRFSRHFSLNELETFLTRITET